jgi:hypothetical protein
MRDKQLERKHRKNLKVRTLVEEYTPEEYQEEYFGLPDFDEMYT